MTQKNKTTMDEIQGNGFTEKVADYKGHQVYYNEENRQFIDVKPWNSALKVCGYSKNTHIYPGDIGSFVNDRYMTERGCEKNEFPDSVTDDKRKVYIFLNGNRSYVTRETSPSEYVVIGHINPKTANIGGIQKIIKEAAREYKI